MMNTPGYREGMPGQSGRSCSDDEMSLCVNVLHGYAVIFSYDYCMNTMYVYNNV